MNNNSSIVTSIDFINACSGGSLAFVKALYHINSSYDNGTLNAAFRVAGFVNSFDIYQWIYTLPGFVCTESQAIFERACTSNYSPLAEWTLDTFSLNTDDNFKFACNCDNLIVAQYMYNMGGLNIQSDINDLYINLFSIGNLNVLQWLHSLEPLSSAMQTTGFLYACKKDQLLAAQWVYGLGNIDINMYKSFILVVSYNTDTVAWLNSLIV